MRDCAAVILAAGEAVRMGAAKPALEFGDSTMVGTVVDSAHAAGLAPIVVVTGFHSDTVEAAVPAIARIAHNPDPNRGNMSSLLVGLDAVGDVDAVVILVTDMPGVTVESIVAVCTGLATGEYDVAWTEYTDGRGHPIAIAARSVPAVRMLTGSKALWPFLDGLDPGVTFRTVIDGPKPVDVNTPADYRSLDDAGGRGDTLEP